MPRDIVGDQLERLCNIKTYMMETSITICKIDNQWEFAVWLRNSNRGSVSILEGWDGEGDGKEAQKRRDICIPMADSG